MLALFVLGTPGLIVPATAEYSVVDSYNMKNVKASYWGSELQKLSADNVHVVIVSHKPDFQETQAARGSCLGESPSAVAQNSADDGFMNGWWKPTDPNAGKTPAPAK
jgi:hypothetical protein